jgi:signal transduction histidine kinase
MQEGSAARRERKDMLLKSLPVEAAEAKVCQARRMEIVGQLTGGVVHDFNNILTVISGTIEILAEAVADRPDLAAIAGLITEAAARGANLTSNLLVFARGQPSPPRDIDVNALLVDAARLLRPTLGEHIGIDALGTADVSIALVDPNLLMTAILNLAVIARDAMPEGGKLTFEITNAVSEQNYSSAETEINAADYVTIAVSASGYGVSAVDSDRAFTDLSVIEDFIKRSNGRINIRDEDGGGRPSNCICRGRQAWFNRWRKIPVKAAMKQSWLSRMTLWCENTSLPRFGASVTGGSLRATPVRL